MDSCHTPKENSTFSLRWLLQKGRVKAKGSPSCNEILFPPKWFNQGRLLETVSLIIYRNSEVQGLEPKPEHLSLLSCQSLVIMFLRVSPTYPTWLFSSIQREKVMMMNFCEF